MHLVTNILWSEVPLTSIKDNITEQDLQQVNASREGCSFLSYAMDLAKMARFCSPGSPLSRFFYYGIEIRFSTTYPRIAIIVR